MEAAEMGSGRRGGGETHLHDLPEPVLAAVFSVVSDVRSRNSMSLVCRKWCSVERSTRVSLALRGNARDLYLLPTCFSSVDHLDLSLLSPWGLPLSGDGGGAADLHHLAAARIRRAFPSPSSLVLYARSLATLTALAPMWAPSLRAVKLVRWHRRPPDLPHGADLHPLLASCPNLKSLDLSCFYCWTEDIPAALGAHHSAAARLTHLDLLSAASSDGFRAAELAAIVAACPSLLHLLAPCAFNPRYIDPVGDDSLLTLAAACPRLTILHLADPFAVSPATAPPVVRDADGFAPEDARMTCKGLESFFSALPRLEHLALDVCHNVRDAAGI